MQSGEVEHVDEHYRSESGSLFVLLVDRPLDILDLTVVNATHPKCGAISSFLGITRDNHEGKMVDSLEYEAYLPMALKEMIKLGKYIEDHFGGIHRVAIAHRLGRVLVGEVSVVIVVSSEHRAEGLQAVQ